MYLLIYCVSILGSSCRYTGKQNGVLLIYIVHIYISLFKLKLKIFFLHTIVLMNFLMLLVSFVIFLIYVQFLLHYINSNCIVLTSFFVNYDFKMIILTLVYYILIIVTL